jgi:site-specific DNA-methyltransferase (adenine-specific)
MDWLSDDGRSLLLCGDVLERMEDIASESVQCCVTSPPYYQLRRYVHGDAREIGHEKTVPEYVARLVAVFREVKRVLRDDGSLLLNIGDSYYDKEPLGVPWQLAHALQRDGWILRQEIIVHRSDPMPEGVQDRCTRAHEHLFLLTKNKRYFWDSDAIAEPTADGKTRNRRSVWKFSGARVKEAHFATMPPGLAKTCIMASTSEFGCCDICGAPLVREVLKSRVATRPGANTKSTGNSEVEGRRDPKRHVTTRTTIGCRQTCSCHGGREACLVLDPFSGYGTTQSTASTLHRSSCGIELNANFKSFLSYRLRDAEQSEDNSVIATVMPQSLAEGESDAKRRGDLPVATGP